MRDVVLSDYAEVKMEYDARRRVAYGWLDYPGRPTFTAGILTDLCRAEADLAFRRIDADFVIWDSTFEGVLGLGGDLETFARLCRAQDLRALSAYGKRAVDAVHANAALFPLHDVETVACVRGDALGGGLEAVLACNTVVAERGVKLGFPEIGFNFFPGMGAASFLVSRVGVAKAKEIMLDPRPRTAEEMHAIGLVDILADKGEGRRVADAWVDGAVAAGPEVRAARRRRAAARLPDYGMLIDVVLDWARTGMRLGPTDLRKMDRLVSAQYRTTGRTGTDRQPCSETTAPSAAVGATRLVQDAMVASPDM